MIHFGKPLNEAVINKKDCYVSMIFSILMPDELQNFFPNVHLAQVLASKNILVGKT